MPRITFMKIVNQRMFDVPMEAIPAPIMAPINPCDALEGSLTTQVNRFHKMLPIKEAATKVYPMPEPCCINTSILMIFVSIV